jgi:transposase
VEEQAFTDFALSLMREPSEKSHWTSRELAALFELQTQVRYSASRWHRVLREKMQMYYYKPRPQDYRQRADTADGLSERIQATFDALQAMGKHPDQIAWGFADEVAAQLHSNNARFWAFAPHLVRKVNTTHRSQRFFGFYAIQGESMISPLAAGKAAAIQEQLLKLRERHQEYKALVIFWDNAPSHKALETWAWERQIYFIPIPAYSPDLNPIEKIWKVVKKWVNETKFVKQVDELTELFQQGFDLVKSQLSFTTSWWIQFKENLSWYSHIFDSNTI